MVQQVLAHRDEVNDTLHASWNLAAEAEATTHMLAMLPTWAEGNADRDAIAKEVAHQIFIVQDPEALEAMAFLLMLFQRAPKQFPKEEPKEQTLKETQSHDEPEEHTHEPLGGRPGRRQARSITHDRNRLRLNLDDYPNILRPKEQPAWSNLWGWGNKATT